MLHIRCARGSLMDHNLATLLPRQRQLITGEMNENIATAVQRMHDAAVGAVLVVRGETLLGICSERMILRRLVDDRLDPRRATLGEIMSSPVLCAHPTMAVDETLRLMTRTRSRHLPIVEEGRLVGIVSIGDLTHWLIRELEDSVDDLTRYIHGTATQQRNRRVSSTSLKAAG